MIPSERSRPSTARGASTLPIRTDPDFANDVRRLIMTLASYVDLDGPEPEGHSRKDVFVSYRPEDNGA
ncbi:MAG TPA: hypothetical protein VGP82_26190 [Ktedonobacterales bacterium]|nr:hypothetical protein [Ktedonobacterales bacterium]